MDRYCFERVSTLGYESIPLLNTVLERKITYPPKYLFSDNSATKVLKTQGVQDGLVVWLFACISPSTPPSQTTQNNEVSEGTMLILHGWFTTLSE